MLCHRGHFGISSSPLHLCPYALATWTTTFPASAQALRRSRMTLRTRATSVKAALKKPAESRRAFSFRILTLTSFSVATCQLEVPNPRIPVDRASKLCRFVVLVHIPEGAAVNWIHGHAAVVAPVSRVFLVGNSPLDRNLSGHGFVGQAPLCGPTARMNAAARHAVSRRRIADFVLGDAGHKAIERGAVVDRAALKQRRAGGAAKFVPANSRLLIRPDSHLHRLADQE